MAAAVWLLGSAYLGTDQDRDGYSELVHPLYDPAQLIRDVPERQGLVELETTDWRTLVSQYPWDVETVLRIIYGPYPCPNGESGGNPRAVSPDGANWGGMQINYASHADKLYAVTGSYDPYLLLDPAVNVAVGYLVYVANSGFGPWRCF